MKCSTSGKSVRAGVHQAVISGHVALDSIGFLADHVVEKLGPAWGNNKVTYCIIKGKIKQNDIRNGDD